ncbi:RNA polymerase sigma-70 factor [Marinilabiliaceae bacterium ANBcel2]|nr:RNA polymerase sigma-70 factor [Marinilabiliaceae bacterium ANBcel2]
MKLSEKFFIKGLKENNKRVIDDIYNKYHQRIFVFAYSIVKEKEEALDIVHEVFIKLWEKRSEIGNDSKFESLIFTIARNTALSILRKKSTKKKYHEQHTKDFADINNTENLIDYNSLKSKIDEFVQQLPPKNRNVYTLSREKGLSNKEIANKLGISEKTVEDHITKALAHLKKQLKQIGISATLYWYLFIW